MPTRTSPEPGAYLDATGNPLYEYWDLVRNGGDNPALDDWKRRRACGELTDEELAEMDAAENPTDEFIRPWHPIDQFIRNRMNVVREPVCRRFAYAIPDEEVIDTLVALGPIVEIGAGRGYWAALITAAGGDVVAYDRTPVTLITGNDYFGCGQSYHPVHVGGPERAAEHPDRVLLLCWPPWGGEMANAAVRAYDGDTIVYVGEPEGGCSVAEGFEELVEERFEWDRRIEIPRWPNYRDEVTIWRR